MNELLYPPSFTAGLSPKDLLDTAAGVHLQLQYGREMAVSLALLRHERRSLVGLLDGVFAPADAAQARFLELARQGRPIVLGDEPDAPRLCRTEAGWVCGATAAYPTATECLQAYAQDW